MPPELSPVRVYVPALKAFGRIRHRWPDHEDVYKIDLDDGRIVDLTESTEEFVRIPDGGTGIGDDLLEQVRQVAAVTQTRNREEVGKARANARRLAKLETVHELLKLARFTVGQTPISEDVLAIGDELTVLIKEVDALIKEVENS